MVQLLRRKDTPVITDSGTFEWDFDGEPVLLDDALNQQLIGQLVELARWAGCG